MPPTADSSHDGRRFLYFAYGSNLLSERIHLCNPSAEFITIGYIEDYSLGFNGTGEGSWRGAGATIYPSPRNKVWGIVWSLSQHDAESLDAQEYTYVRISVTVRCPTHSSSELVCVSYKKATGPYNHKPSPHYKCVILAGAKEHHLPQDYIDWLASFEDNGYVGSICYKFTVIEHLNVIVN